MRLRYSFAALAIGISSLAQAAIDPQYQYLSALPAPQDTLVLPLIDATRLEPAGTLAAASGTAFDRLFLEMMIAHHRGAVSMTNNLLRWYGTASDPEMNQFTSDVVSDQNAEIARMNRRLATLSQ